jgi:site-specific DNA-methyltransferase (adenine-specific)
LLELPVNKINCGDVLRVLKRIPDECVDCIVTSPPYYGLRDYGVGGQMGLELSFQEYLERMLAVTAELKRVLKPTGTMWWNHGDAYLGSSKGAGDKNPDPKYTNKARSRNLPKAMGLQKCLMLQNYRLAQRMIDEQDWILRNTIIWHKPNVMPSSVKDRFTVDYEPVFFFTKSKKYWFEMQHEPLLPTTLKDRRTTEGYKNIRGRSWDTDPNSIHNPMGSMKVNIQGRNKRSVWKIPIKPYKEAHFATFPAALIETPIKAGCPEFICKKCGKAREKIYKGTSNKAFNIRVRDVKNGRIKHIDRRASGAEIKFYRENYGEGKQFFGYTDCGCKAGWEPGIVLDPFMGSGTTALVAQRLDRRWIGIELNPEYIKIADGRLTQTQNFPQRLAV